MQFPFGSDYISACPVANKLLISACKYYEPRHDKTNKMSVRPAKTQISLGIRLVWLESSLFAWRTLWSLANHWAHSEDSDQTRRMPRLIWVFAGRKITLLVLSCRGSYFKSIWSYWNNMSSTVSEKRTLLSCGLRSFKGACAPTQTVQRRVALCLRFVSWLCERTAKALARLHVCAGSSDHWLFAYVISNFFDSSWLICCVSNILISIIQSNMNQFSAQCLGWNIEYVRRFNEITVLKNKPYSCGIFWCFEHNRLLTFSNYIFEFSADR